LVESGHSCFKLIVPLPHHRSPDFLLVVAGAVFGLSLLCWFVIGEGPLTWALMICAVPPAFENEVVRRSAQIGAMVYSRDEDEITSLTYDFTGAVLRCVFMTVVLLLDYLLGRGGYNILPDNGWTILLIVGPVIAYVVWGGCSYWRRIASVARSRSWARRRRR